MGKESRANARRFHHLLNGRRQTGLSGQQAVSAAFAISNKIANEGTEIFKQGGTDLLEILEAPETISKITKHLADHVTADVQLFLEREIVKAW